MLFVVAGIAVGVGVGGDGGSGGGGAAAGSAGVGEELSHLKKNHVEIEPAASVYFELGYRIR